ncbi:MAG TPA: NAD(P)(+) transhydrogenase (Re/Si-specific) subunit beta, partial [Agriterribacter sp.]|nr:NAD(P)(+) transhydrogenase (Re/Si-specific) subunit beta [Agriterribacter sp.]
MSGLQSVPGLTAIDTTFQAGLRQHLLIILAGLVIGSISFAGSMVAWGKLNGRIRDFIFTGQHIFNIVLLLVIFFMALYLVGWLPAGGVSLFYI